MPVPGCAGTQLIYTGVSQTTLTVTITAKTAIITSVLVGLGTITHAYDHILSILLTALT